MTKQQHIPPTCGASLPHDNPMAKQFHQMQVQKQKEVIQDSAEARELEQAGWRYFRTYHDSDRASATYGKRIDIYRKGESE